MLVVDDERHGAWPTAAGEATGERRHIGNEIGRFFGTFDGEGHGVAGRAALHLEQTFDGIGAAGAGGQAVYCFRRDRDQLAFGERLNGPVHHVAGVFGVPDIDDDRRHRNGGRTGSAKKKRRNAASFAGGGLIIRRMINYIVFRGGRSRIHDASQRTQILGILKVWAVRDGCLRCIFGKIGNIELRPCVAVLVAALFDTLAI